MSGRVRMNHGDCILVVGGHHRPDYVATPEPPTKRKGFHLAASHQPDALRACQQSDQQYPAICTEGGPVQFDDGIQIPGLQRPPSVQIAGHCWCDC